MHYVHASIEQSKELLTMLDKKTADCSFVVRPNNTVFAPWVDDTPSSIPCWSFAALYAQLPKNHFGLFTGKQTNPFIGEVAPNDYRCVYLSSDMESDMQTYGANPVSAVINMLKLQQKMQHLKIHCCFGVRYFSDGVINGQYDTDSHPTVPCVKEEDGELLWCPTIDAATGQILNWEKGKTAAVHYKVCDQCAFSLMCGSISDGVGERSLLDYDDYVPDFMDITGEGYGDCIIWTINADGFIQGWSHDKVLDFIKKQRSRD